MNDIIRIAGFLNDSIVNGEGLRDVIFVSGCKFNCPNCQNKNMQDELYGDSVNIKDIVDKVLSNELIDGVTISGGEPTLQYENISRLIYQFKKHNINIWLYTGETYEIIKEKYKYFLNVDVIVDGRYIEELKDNTLKYRGSSNQRIIKLSDNTIV